jgi:serine phosphatase RsbU (regulator of sigma subunit)
MISIIRSKKNAVLKEKNEELEDKKAEIESQRDLLNQTHEQLKVRNKDVTDSIHYAQKIQQAMLNSSFHIDGSGVDYFTFYKPRDIVSGDFYWSNVVGDELIVAIGDCTGHGVPGAFMSCLGISLLNEIVFGREIIQPHNILEELRNSVIQLIATDKNADLQMGDGMDIAIISLNLKTNFLKFSGAMNGLVIVSGNHLEEVKGDKNPIGQHILPNHRFTLIEKQLKVGDSIYATTDGYKDQFGGPKGKKLGKRRLHDKFLEIASLSVPVQKTEVVNFYKSWRKYEEQIDDVCLFGMKLES